MTRSHLHQDHNYFMGFARQAATRATCNRRRVGAVAVDKRGHVLVTGYNGSPPGEPHCIDEGCLLEDGHCVRTIHAEMNLIVQAARRGTSLEGSTVYCTLEPCWRCMQLLQAAGVDVSCIRYEEPYHVAEDPEPFDE